MKIDDVITLLNAGFTREEIQQMEAAGSEFSHESGPIDPAPVIVTRESSTAAPEPAQPEPAEDPSRMPGADLADAFDQAISRMNSLFDEKLKQIQTANVQAARMPEDKSRTVDDIIGDIIKPTMGKRIREE